MRDLELKNFLTENIEEKSFDLRLGKSYLGTTLKAQYRQKIEELDFIKIKKVWQKALQYCKVISLQLIKINERKKYTHIHANMLPFCLLK